jgi:hypothetical protein
LANDEGLTSTLRAVPKYSVALRDAHTFASPNAIAGDDALVLARSLLPDAVSGIEDINPRMPQSVA